MGEPTYKKFNVYKTKTKTTQGLGLLKFPKPSHINA